MLNGYLTYLAGAGFVMMGLYQIVVSNESQKGVENIIAGFAIIGGRRALGKVGQ